MKVITLANMTATEKAVLAEINTIQHHDEDHDTISFSEFKAHTEYLIKNINSGDQIKHVFTLFDSDEDNEMSLDEIKEFAKRLGKSCCCALAFLGSMWLNNFIEVELSSEVQEEILKADKDRNQKINYTGTCWSPYIYFLSCA